MSMLTRAVVFLLLAVPVTGRSQGPAEAGGGLP